MAAVRSLLRSSASLLRAAPALARSSATTRPSLRRALAAPPRLLRYGPARRYSAACLLPDTVVSKTQSCGRLARW
uniref:Uncharacterized protein n=1 Tax=Zea mays TaxID=4577 RepID=C0PDU7_MAIZE|nr:unknown [Zea mays]